MNNGRKTIEESLAAEPLELTPTDCANLADALQEWHDVVGPKELDENETGLDSERFDDLMKRLLKTNGENR